MYFCRCGKPAGGIYSFDFNIIKQEKKELNASFCPPKQKSRRQGHGGQSAAPGLLPLVGMILLDYVLAFSFLGLACVFAKPFKNKLVGVAVGSAAVCVLRFLCSFLSGVLIWGNLSDGLPAWIYSLTYNGSYMLPEGIMTTSAVVLLYKAAPQLFSANN